jgi:hypothetical protein
MPHVCHTCLTVVSSSLSLASQLVPAPGNGRQGQFHCQDMGNNGLDMAYLISGVLSHTWEGFEL